MRKKKIDEKLFVAKELQDNVGAHTAEIAKKHRVKIDNTTDPSLKKRKYTKTDQGQRLNFIQGFDLMQYNIVVRDFIVKLYKLKNQYELDILCYLFPIQFFTGKDFRVLPVKKWGTNLKQMIEDGYIDIKIHSIKGAGNIYGLSEHATRAVRDYYYYLSGEKTMNLKSTLNPYKYPQQTRVDNQLERVMLKLKRQSEHSPKLFTNYHD